MQGLSLLLRKVYSLDKSSRRICASVKVTATFLLCCTYLDLGKWYSYDVSAKQCFRTLRKKKTKSFSSDFVRAFIRWNETRCISNTSTFHFTPSADILIHADIHYSVLFSLDSLLLYFRLK